MAGLGNIDDVYNHYLKVIEENKQLRQLLKECRDGYVSTDLDDDLLLNQYMARDLVTRINAAIGESEE